MDITLIGILIGIALIGIGVFVYVKKQAAQGEASSAENLHKRIAFLQEGLGDQGLLESRDNNSIDIGNDFSNFFASFTPIPSKAKLDLLNKAGLRTPNAHITLFMKKLTGLIAGVSIGLLSCFVMGMSGLGIGILLGYLFWSSPESELKKKAEERAYNIDKTLPDLIDLFANCCLAGVSFDTAAGYILNDLEDDPLIIPIKEDFLAWQSDVNLGVERTPAWKRLSDRSDSRSIRSFTSLINQSEKTGGSVSEALFKMSGFFRERRKQQLEAEIAQLPTKMSGQTIVFIVLPIVVLLMLPIGVNMFETVGSVFGGR